MPEKEVYDVIIIGAGTAGTTVALYAASHDYKTALVDPGDLGGVCLNTGCIPTKAMLHASYLHYLAQEMKEFGIHLQKIEMDFSKIMKRVKDIVLEGRKSLEFNLKNRNLTIIKEKGSFVSKKEIKVGNNIIKGGKIIICTGAKPKVPPLKGLEKVKYLLSDDVLELKTLPKSLIIIGGGYISMEFSTFFKGLGTKVIVLEALDRLVLSCDGEISRELEKYCIAEGTDIKTGIKIIDISNLKKEIQVRYEKAGKKGIITAEKLLVATGRAPNTFSLDLGAAGIEKTSQGAIRVNETMQTSNPDVYAIGDVNGKALLAHAAKREAYIAIKNALEKTKETIDYDRVPWAVFTHPPIGGIGISEEVAKNKKINYGVLKAEFKRVSKSIISGDRRGMIKVIYHKKNKKIIGCFMIGDKADELIHEFSALLTLNATINDLKKIIHVHPTLAEVIEILKEVK